MIHRRSIRSQAALRRHRWRLGFGPLMVLLAAAASTALAHEDDRHWSRQFPRPAQSAQMSAATGMTDGTGSPTVARVQWHDGKLWFAGAWEPGISARDFGSRQLNEYWYMWTWSPTEGYQVVAHFHGAQGGSGPDGVINDFVFLPDGRMVVAGEFGRLDNPGGNRYHNVNALAVFDPAEPGPDRWRPLGRVQYNGTISPGGSIQALAYDPQGNHLYIGGSFTGVPLPNPVRSNAFHRYSFDTGSYEVLTSGPGGGRPRVHRIVVDSSTSPSTIYVGGDFEYVGGNGLNPENGASTASYSTSFATYRDGVGWSPFPSDFPTDGSGGREDGILQRAGDYAAFDSAIVRDILIDGSDIWICGSFSEGQGQAPLRGIARWDAQREVWVDPTGRGGVGRDCFSVAKAADGRIYFSGAFGGRSGVNAFYDGFKNGDPAHGAIAYDPASDSWSQLGSGLSSRVMPEIRMAVDGHDVYFTGDFSHIDPANFGNGADAGAEASYLARWNPTIDFLAQPPVVGARNTPYQAHGVQVGPPPGSEHWSRVFVHRQRNDGRVVAGMSDGIGTPDISGIVWIGDTLYFGGSWEAETGTRWYVWSLHPQRGYERLAWARGEGIQSPPEGVKAHDGRLYAYGAISSHSGIGVFDPASGSWSTIEGSYRGQPVVGNSALQGAGVVNDIAFDEANGDLYLVGNWASPLALEDSPQPNDTAAVIRIDRDGEYHILGHDLKPEDPQRPIKGVYAIVLDPSQSPTGIYVAGTFNYYGPVPTTNARMIYNVARWDYDAKEWAPVGHGNFVHLSEVDAHWYPEGLPGLPTKPTESGYTNYHGFLNPGFPRILSLALDRDGNLYAGGTLGIVSRDESLLARHQVETYGVARYDRASDTWGPATAVGGVSRDVRQMTFLDDRRLLLSGSFVYDEQWNQLHNVAILDVVSGELSPLGGGLHRAARDHTIGSQVVHAVLGEQLWFAGLFDYAGINGNAMHAAPVESAYIALYDPSRILDPNHALEVAPVEAVAGPTGPSSVEATVTLSARLSSGEGTITWYERRSDGAFVSRGSGESFRASVRIAPGSSELFYYVTVTLPNGWEGGKLPVRIPVR